MQMINGIDMGIWHGLHSPLCPLHMPPACIQAGGAPHTHACHTSPSPPGSCCSSPGRGPGQGSLYGPGRGFAPPPQSKRPPPHVKRSHPRRVSGPGPGLGRRGGGRGAPASPPSTASRSGGGRGAGGPLGLPIE